MIKKDEKCNDWADGCDGELELWSSTDGEYFYRCFKCDSIYPLGGCPRELVFSK